jgi:hypothetical protein
MLEHTKYQNVERIIIWLKKIICPIQKRNKKGENELDKEIEIKVPKYKLHLFYDESIKQLYKTTVNKYIKISYEGSVQKRNMHLK